MFPHPREIMPHDGKMLLVERLVFRDEASAECIVNVDDSELFANEDGTVPSWVALEYMAQTIAAYGGADTHATDREVRPGLFIGSRRVKFNVDAFTPHSVLRTRVEHVRGRAPGLMAFDCSVRPHDADPDSPPLVNGVLNVYVLDNFDAMLDQYRVEEGDG